MKLSTILKWLKPFIVTALGIFFAGLFNIFEYFSFIPANLKFGTAVTAYTGFLGVIIDQAIKTFEGRNSIKLTCIFFTRIDSIDISCNPIVELNNAVDFGKIYCKIQISGNAKRLLDKHLVIYFPNWVDVQTESIVEIEPNCMKLHISNILSSNKSKHVNLERTFCLSFLRRKCADHCLEDIEIKLAKDKKISINLFCEFKSNTFKLIN